MSYRSNTRIYYWHELDLAQRSELVAGLVLSALAFRYASDSLDPMVYTVSFLWLSAFGLRAIRSLGLDDRGTLRRVLGDVLLILLVHVCFSLAHLLSAPWMIVGAAIVPALHIVAVVAWYRAKPPTPVDEHALTLAEQLTMEKAEVEKYAGRWKCLIGLHLWIPHAKLDHLCICDRCTRIAQHRLVDGACSRCGHRRE